MLKTIQFDPLTDCGLLTLRLLAVKAPLGEDGASATNVLAFNNLREI
jgi:hypothetical protein